MKDRLVELIKKSRKYCNHTDCGNCGRAKFGGFPDCKDIQLADYLLENGVIVPPCKVGDEVYLVTPNGKIREINITDIYMEIKPTATVMRLSATFYVDNKPYFFQVSPFDFGKTIFLTREEAEAKLKEGGEG